MGGSRLAGPATGVAALAATAALAFDAGGFHAVSSDRAIVLLAAAALALLLLLPSQRPGRLVLATVGAYAGLTAWTAASYLWAASPPAALAEAQRVGAYLACACAVAAAGRRAPLGWLAGGVAAGIVPVGCWNLALRLAPDWTGRPRLAADIGSLADPVGYANALALLDVVALLLLLGVATLRPAPLRIGAAVALVPVAADLGLLQSSGALLALAAGLLVLLAVAGRERGWTAAALLVLPLAAFAGVASVRAVVSPLPTDVLAAAGDGHRLLAALALVTVAQVGVAQLVATLAARLPGLPRRPTVAAAAALAAAGLAVGALSLGRHDRLHYWRVAVREVAAEPLLGGGAGSYVDWWVQRRDVSISTEEAHSLYLETLAELGPVGLLLVAAALGVPLAAAWRLRRQEWGPPVLAALVAYALHAGVDFDWELAGATVPVVLVGAGAAVAAAPAPVAARRSAAAVAAAGGLAALAACGILALAGSAPLAAAQDAAAAGDNGAALSDARRALRFAPWSAEAWRVIGRVRAARGDRAGARAAFATAVRRDRADWQTWVELADVSSGAPRRAALAEAARRNPLWAARPNG